MIYILFTHFLQRSLTIPAVILHYLCLSLIFLSRPLFLLQWHSCTRSCSAGWPGAGRCARQIKGSLSNFTRKKEAYASLLNPDKISLFSKMSLDMSHRYSSSPPLTWLLRISLQSLPTLQNERMLCLHVDLRSHALLILGLLQSHLFSLS